MATKKTPAKPSARASSSKTSARSTASGPARPDQAAPGDALVEKMDGAEALAAALPANPNKAGEYGAAAARPPQGAVAPVSDHRATGSTLTEAVPSAKAGAGAPLLGASPGSLPLDRVRTDATERRLTTNLGVPVADNQHALKAGLRG